MFSSQHCQLTTISFLVWNACDPSSKNSTLAGSGRSHFIWSDFTGRYQCYFGTNKWSLKASTSKPINTLVITEMKHIVTKGNIGWHQGKHWGKVPSIWVNHLVLRESPQINWGSSRPNNWFTSQETKVNQYISKLGWFSNVPKARMEPVYGVLSSIWDDVTLFLFGVPRLSSSSLENSERSVRCFRRTWFRYKFT